MKKLLLTLLISFSLGCACVLLLDTNTTVNAKSTKETIMIDAGHGGYDTGSISANNEYEKDINLKIALALGKKLQASGYNVVYTRTNDNVSWSSDNTQDLQTRCDMAVSKHADYFISIHLNSSEYEANGYEIYCDFNNMKTKKLSNNILKQLDSLNYSTNRGLQDTNETALYVISHNEVPAILIEAGFISNTSDLSYIQNHTQSLVNAIYKGIEKSLS